MSLCWHIHGIPMKQATSLSWIQSFFRAPGGVGTQTPTGTESPATGLFSVLSCFTFFMVKIKGSSSQNQELVLRRSNGAETADTKGGFC